MHKLRFWVHPYASISSHTPAQESVSGRRCAFFQQRKPVYPWPALLMAAALWLLAACQPVAAPTPVASGTESGQASGEPLALQADTAPVKLSLPQLSLEIPVEPMGWTVTEVDGARTTQWIVPQAAVGWHVNSAGAGAAGNTILSGYQAAGEALLAPLATGEVAAGQEILLTTADGRIFTYRIREVTEPIAITGATAAEIAQASAYVAPSAEPLLTLITGWPDFTTTHRIFAVAEFVGESN
ncbi:MAG: sortase [Chloroflexota bacterium]|nr:sortase [Chloroflexota bacterium]